MNFPPPWVSPTPPHSPAIYTLDGPNCVISYWTAWIFIFLITVKFRIFECHWPLFFPLCLFAPLAGALFSCLSSSYFLVQFSVL